MRLPVLSLILLLLYYAPTSLVRGEIVTERLLVLDQLNASQDLTNKLVCQKFTDILPQQPRLFVADDFLLPTNISTNITLFQLAFTILRLRHDSDPDAITVLLMYHDPVRQGPGAVFFTKTIRAPNNPPRWANESLGKPEIITINITVGEESSEDASVVFDLQNTTFLPRDTRLWLGLYVTGSRSYVETPYAENIFFWCTTDQPVPMMRNNTNQRNAPFFFIDSSDILGKGLSNWSNASTVESLLRMNSGTKNMAWSLTLLGTKPSSLIEMLQALGSKEMVAAIVCSVIGFAFVCGCALCICKRCKRCWPRKASSPPIYDLYSPVDEANGHKGVGDDLHVQLSGGSGPASKDTFSEVSLEHMGHSTSGVAVPSKLRHTPSGAYLESATKLPVRTKQTADYDKNK